MGQRPNCVGRFVPGRSAYRDECPTFGTFIPVERERICYERICSSAFTTFAESFRHGSKFRFSFESQNSIHFTCVCLVSLCLDTYSAILCCTREYRLCHKAELGSSTRKEHH